jgi:leucine dehydrogenase
MYHLNQKGLNNVTIALQGLGKVGSHLLDYIVQDYPKTKLIIADIDNVKVGEMLRLLKDKGIAVRRIEPNEIYNQTFDIFSPNAMGQVVNPSTVRRMMRSNRDRKLIIVGAANNQIDDRHRGSRKEVEGLLKRFDILYAPDFVVNLGGILNLIYEFETVKGVFGGKYNQERPLEVIQGIRPILRQIYDRSKATRLSTQAVADRLAEEHIARWAIFNGLGHDDLIDRSYLVDVLPTSSGNTIPIS